jgi:hypothetical protein
MVRPRACLFRSAVSLFLVQGVAGAFRPGSSRDGNPQRAPSPLDDCRSRYAQVCVGHNTGRFAADRVTPWLV